MNLVNHAVARVAPAIFVIFVVFTGYESKSLVLLGRSQIRHVCHFRQNPLLAKDPAILKILRSQ